MANAFLKVPHPVNEGVRNYAPGSPERAAIKSALTVMAETELEIPMIIGGREVTSGDLGTVSMPHDHKQVIARFHQARPEHVEMAVAAAAEAWKEWSEYGWEDRASVFLKAADLLAGPWRDRLNAATMLGQSKNVMQAEVDSACELIDFLLFNVYFMSTILADQPLVSPTPLWNRCEYRALEGFVFAVTPFNFTAIAGNLCMAPAVMGNVVVWKPAATAVLSNYYVMKLFEEAGLPPGVINFIPGPSAAVGEQLLEEPALAGIHFTGSTPTFQHLWRRVGENIANYRSYPRVVGETGGKDFIFAHQSADPAALRTAIVRGAFEYQGQKCSAASRAYIPDSLWKVIKPDLVSEVSGIATGDIQDFTNLMGAVIDQPAFEKIKGYIDYAKASSECEIIAGGRCDDSRGWFIEPTVIETSNPHFKTMHEEIFGPVVTICPYRDGNETEMLGVCDTTSPYALTGAVFARERDFIVEATARLRHAAGNFYINDKPTGAVVGQQPFGGGRASGTNDKAGSAINLLKWTSVRTIKENFVPPTEYRYPHMKES